MIKKLILIGGGGHCKSCIDVIEQTGLYEIAGIIDTQENVGQRVLGYEIIATDQQILTLADQGYEFIVTIGQVKTSQIRKKLYNKLVSCDADVATITSPHAYVSKHSSIQEGTIIMHQALVNANVKIGKNCIINTKALIEHDVVIKDNCHISTASVINGKVILKQNNFFGSNATSRENIQIEDFVKAGSLRK